MVLAVIKTGGKHKPYLKLTKSRGLLPGDMPQNTAQLIQFKPSLQTPIPCIS